MILVGRHGWKCDLKLLLSSCPNFPAVTEVSQWDVWGWKRQSEKVVQLSREVQTLAWGSK